jgi:hypothetical protein
LKYKVNAYFASLLITLIGAGASLLIIHVAYANAFAVTYASAL